MRSRVMITVVKLIARPELLLQRGIRLIGLQRRAKKTCLCLKFFVKSLSGVQISVKSESTQYR